MKTTPSCVSTFRAALLYAVASTGSLFADPLPVGNPSFEDSTTPISWPLLGGTSFVVNRNNAPFNTVLDPTPDPGDDAAGVAGEQALFVSTGWHYQILSSTLQANMTYTLTIDVGDRSDLAFREGVMIGLSYTTGPNANSDFVMLTPSTMFNPTPTNGAGANDGWVTWVFTFQTGMSPAGLGQPLRIDLNPFPSGQNNNFQAYFDNVRLDGAVIPEPGTIGLLFIGAAAIFIRHRMRAG